MTTTLEWKVDIQLVEEDHITHATARLHTDTGTEPLVGFGTARCNPIDRDVPEIGDELASARALSDLAHRLLDASVADIEAMTHNAARVPL